MAADEQIYDNGMTTAAADLSADQYLAVKVTADFAVNLNTVAGAPIYGVLQNKPTLGQSARVRRLGVTKMVAGAAVAAGARVMSDAAGKAITAATVGSTSIGIALNGAAGAGEIFSVDLVPYSGTV